MESDGPGDPAIGWQGAQRLALLFMRQGAQRLALLFMRQGAQRLALWCMRLA